MPVQTTRFYGRPRKDVVRLRDLTIRSRSRLWRRLDPDREMAATILESLSVRDRDILKRYISRTEDDHAMAGMVLALDWLLGEGLSQIATRRAFLEPWGEEYDELSIPWKR